MESVKDFRRGFLCYSVANNWSYSENDLFKQQKNLFSTAE